MLNYHKTPIDELYLHLLLFGRPRRSLARDCKRK